MKTPSFLALALVACQPIPSPSPSPSPPPPTPDADAAPPEPIDAHLDECAMAYRHLAAIRCEPTKPASGTWIDVCRNGRQNGLFALHCLNVATSVDAAQKCGVTCK